MSEQNNKGTTPSNKNSDRLTEFTADLYESTIEAAKDFSVIYRKEQKNEAAAQNGDTESYQGTR